ncbi:MAG: phosphoethanolamine--lipid A transferase [Betaproteobacteria bacterium]|nr:phosphoethanolamine--lipid A transferase [Betaproteobacteria bacterium]
MTVPRFSFELTRLQLMLATTLWISLLPNLATLRAFAAAPSAGDGLSMVFFVFGGWLFVFVVTFALIAALSALFWGRSLRWVCAAMLVLAATFGYFSLFLGTQFDKTMILNMMQTHPGETLELIHLRLLLWVAVVGVLPAWLVWRVRLKSSPSRLRAVFAPVLTLVALVSLMGASIFALYPRYASAARNRAITFDTVAPANVLAASVHQAAMAYRSATVRAPRGLDAHQAYAIKKPRLVVFVLGETARAQNQGLNGYERDTTPRMRAAGGYYFADTESCGTATAISVPCLFSGFGREAFTLNKGLANETLIDVVVRGGARVLWRDNDSGCKGVCAKADVIDLTGSSDPRWCPEKGECFDEMLLDGLEKKLREASRDTLVVLHLKGSHGPAYYKRYPPAFEKFAPTCRSSDIASCDPQTIRNSYDNSILYTDHVLGETVTLLQRLSDQFATAMLYASDHGESLGESGLYLHGMPYALAPKEQTRVPMYAWVSPQFARMENWDTACMAGLTRTPRRHDHIYSTLLGFMEIETAEYKHDLDIFDPCDGGANPAGTPGDMRGRKKP